VDANRRSIGADPQDLPHLTGGELIPDGKEEGLAVSLGEGTERGGDFRLAGDHGGGGGGEKLRHKSAEEGFTSYALPAHVGEDLAADTNRPSDLGALRYALGLLPEEQHGFTDGVFGLVGRRSTEGVPPGRLVHAINQRLELTHVVHPAPLDVPLLCRNTCHNSTHPFRGLCHPLDTVPNRRSNTPMTRHDQDRKTRILQAIAEGIRRSGTPPTVREIADLVGLAAPSAVHHHLETLEQEGLIERGAGLSRSVRLTARGRALLEIDSELETTNLPMAARELVVVGQIAAGGPIEAYEERSETVAVPEFMSTPDSYLLKIRGDSMIDAQIADGDYVVIKPSKVAADGDIVVAQVEENEVTLKQLFRETGRVRLQPANKAYKPMYYPTVNVQGVLVGVLRRVH